eukprot:CAMPEP_0117744756 /NCGR_PEP_ID=MMETSP0947-20121206/6953_1 /TAXON_ID=44440 /ORGANISM="Chattonella subsalsa, Strain CCMP2191" /LENGTH=309 /DNA_ID=CAMNT_0005561775 /DNA_START=102 /DNA_END=1031 /DNA_ORIENTATION=+
MNGSFVISYFLLFVSFVNGFGVFNSLDSYQSTARYHHVGQRYPILNSRKFTSLKMFENSEIEYFDPTIPVDPITASKSTVRELPIFPLNLVAIPTAMCPLHIFEMRYRQMMNAIQETDEKFGIILVDPTTGALASVGTIVQVYQRSLLDDGRQLIMNYGTERFKLIQILKDKPYMVALVDTDYSDITGNDNEAKELEEEVWGCLKDVVRLTNKVQDKQSVSISEEVTRFSPSDEPNYDSAQEISRRSNFSFALANMLDIPPLQKQLMLQTLDAKERLKFQHTMLYDTLKYLAAQSSLKDALGDVGEDLS